MMFTKAVSKIQTNHEMCRKNEELPRAPRFMAAMLGMRKGHRRKGPYKKERTPLRKVRRPNSSMHVLSL